ncbi:hypothetical protein Scep_003042 [Stephania cephalantha]|uniref:BHLH domain-containing protein n=1 Tax=Stephania cephalantha TaxID=152367 RepID=A0AAP0LBC5_9MAGN
MDSVQILVDRLRHLVSAKNWDYGALWKVDGDQRIFELVGCCCGGAESCGSEEFAYPVTPLLLPPSPSPSPSACRDTIGPHQRTSHCHLLARLPSTMSLEDSSSGDHAQALISSQPRWISLSDSNGKSGTKVLIPVAPPGALMIELFSAKQQVSEDPRIIEFATALSTTNNVSWSWGQEALSCTHSSSIDVLGQELESPPLLRHDRDEFHTNKHLSISDSLPFASIKNNNNPCWMSQGQQQQQAAAATLLPADDTTTLNNNLSCWDLSSLDQIRLSTNSPINTIMNHSSGELIQPRDDHMIAFEGSSAEESILSDRHMMMMMMMMPGNSSKADHDPHQLAYAYHDHADAGELIPDLPAVDTSTAAGANKTLLLQHASTDSSSCVIPKDTGGHEQKDSIKQETMGNKADSISDCSDQIEDDDDHKVVGRSGRRHQSKNLVAERKRRKKLNDRLYALRALVPKITKMDRASILGDAIEFVKELQKQVKELQDELEELPNGDGVDKQHISKIDITNPNSTAHQSEMPNENGSICVGNKLEAHNDSLLDGLNVGSRSTSRSKQSQDYVVSDDKTQQMEVQVDVTQINGSEFYLKVFCEYKPSGFVRLMEAMNSLGLEVTNANVTTFRGLVLNVFKVEKRDNELVQADHVRESLLELTRNPLAGWSTEQRSSLDYHHHDPNHYINSHHHHLHSLQTQT